MVGFQIGVLNSRGGLFFVAEFDFEVIYKNGRNSTQADALSRLNYMRKTIPHVGKDDIPELYLEIVNDKLELNKTNDDTDFVDV